MSFAEAQSSEYNGRDARRNLARAVSAYEQKRAELSELQTAVKAAELKISSLRETIDASDAEDRLAEAAAESLRSDKAISARNPALLAKEKRDETIKQWTLLKSGHARLMAKASGAEREAETEYAELLRVREPIVQHVLETLADELAAAEEKAAILWSRLYGFSVCSNASVPQKLPALAISLLRNPPKNAAHPVINSPGHFRVQREKECFREWKKRLESDSQATLEL